MRHADPALPSQRIDAKRVVATAGAIAVHVGILMALMMPPPLSVPIEKEEVVVPIWDEKRELPKPPDPPPTPRPIETRTTPQPTPVAIPQALVEPVDSTPGPMDIPMPDLPPTENSFEVAPQGPVFQQLSVVSGAAPPYPRMAMQRGIEGTVVLRIHVDATGKPIEVIVEQSSGSRILDEAAQKFVQARWRFAPAMQNGQAVDGWGLLPVDFVLD